ncbi:hypothetical protein MNBD_CHLOROFLEXI01-2328, partial [hydrothermal vent metagenome]
MIDQSFSSQSTQVEPLVSVIIVTFNSDPYILDCLNALQSQAYQAVEIIIYDNASSDRTISFIQTNFPAVKLMIGKTNLGFAAANNLAANEAKGEFLAFLNPDTIAEPNWLHPLIKTVTTNTTIGAVTPQIVFAHDPARVNTCGNTVHLSGITYCQQYDQPLSKGEPYTVSAVSGAAFVISQKLFEALGGFEERFFMYYEDTDLSLRIHCAGLLCTAVPASIVRHVYKPAFSAQKIFYLERNRYLSLFSLISWQLFLFMMPSL